MSLRLMLTSGTRNRLPGWPLCASPSRLNLNSPTLTLLPAAPVRCAKRLPVRTDAFLPDNPCSPSPSRPFPILIPFLHLSSRSPPLNLGAVLLELLFPLILPPSTPPPAASATLPTFAGIWGRREQPAPPGRARKNRNRANRQPGVVALLLRTLAVMILYEPGVPVIIRLSDMAGRRPHRARIMSGSPS